MDRKPSQDPTAHRDLIVSVPPQEGRDVANLQRAIHDRLKARNLLDDVVVPLHGKFTTATWAGAAEAGYWLGLMADTALAHEKDGSGITSQGAQAIIRNPSLRTPVMLRRAGERKAALKDGPRYADELLHKSGRAGKGAEAAIKWALAQVGTTEHPAGSNWGPGIEDWIRAAGYNGPVFWCGCFANAVVMHGGVPNCGPWGVGYVPNIIQHAKAGTGGWSWHGPADGQRGDLPCFDEAGGAVGDHVGGAVLKRINASTYETVEGNTSSAGGSQSNGGGVFVKTRTTGGSFRLVGFARPPYAR